MADALVNINDSKHNIHHGEEDMFDGHGHDSSYKRRGTFIGKTEKQAKMLRKADSMMQDSDGDIRNSDESDHSVIDGKGKEC